VREFTLGAPCELLGVLVFWGFLSLSFILCCAPFLGCTPV
jgi:hypothetical protein